MCIIKKKYYANINKCKFIIVLNMCIIHHRPYRFQLRKAYTKNCKIKLTNCLYLDSLIKK